MNEHANNSEDDEPIQLSTAEVDEIGSEFSEFLKRRLIMWAVRWTIGFALVWAIVANWPEYFWLWWVAGGFATASLLLLVVGGWMVRRKVKRTTDKIDEANELLREEHDSPDEPGD